MLDNLLGRVCRKCSFFAICTATLISSTLSGLTQNLSGLEIGNDVSSAEALGSKPIGRQNIGPHTAVKYELPGGNMLSFTYRRSDRRIVYIETDWGGRQAGSLSDFGNFRFGTTTLDDIRLRFGHSGMTFLERPGVSFSEDGGIISFNSFGLVQSSVIVTFVTKIPKIRIQALSPDTIVRSIIGIESKLDAIIIADKSYLETIWGVMKISDQDYRDIDWQD